MSSPSPQLANLLSLCRQAMHGAILAVDKWVDCSLALVAQTPVDLADFQRYLEDAGSQKDTLVLQLKGDLVGALSLNLSRRMTHLLLEPLVEEEIDPARPLSRSALLEMTNLIGSSFANSLAEATELSLLPSVPQLLEESNLLPDYFSPEALGVRFDLEEPSDSSGTGVLFVFLQPEGLTQLLGDEQG